MIRVLEYVDARGRSPYRDWFESLDTAAADKVATAAYRLADGNFSNVKSVGAGVLEKRIDFGPGYRIYFGKQGDQLVILLGGSAKARQSDAISIARARWWEYRSRQRK